MTLKDLRQKRQHPRTLQQIRAHSLRGKRRKEMAWYALYRIAQWHGIVSGGNNGN